MRKAINFNGRDFNSVMVETILDVYKTKVETLKNLEKYQRRVMFCKEYRFIFDVTNLEGVLMGEIKVQKKGDNGRYADMCVYDTDSAMTFVSFLEETFDVMFSADDKVMTEEERKVAMEIKKVAKNMGFEFNGAEGEYLVSAANDCTYTVGVTLYENYYEINQWLDGLMIIDLMKDYSEYSEEDLVDFLKDSIAEVADSALESAVSYLNDDCDDSIVDTFGTTDEEYGVDFRDKEKSDAVIFSYDKETKSVIIRDYDGEEKLTDFESLASDFTDYCTEKFGEEYTRYWTYAA